ncbi:hypothetical protein KKC45_00290 [Patescibacteria group bacterium]|nr:hypothetical protein [Patescibacteria group bacterium]
MAKLPKRTAFSMENITYYMPIIKLRRKGVKEKVKRKGVRNLFKNFKGIRHAPHSDFVWSQLN